MNKVQIQQIISLPIVIGIIFSMAINGFLLVQGKEEIGHLFMNYYNRQPTETFPFYTTGVLMFSGLLQLLTALLLFVSILKREFMLRDRARFLKWGILSGILALVLYGFAVRMISNHQAAANLFFYTGFLYFFLWSIEKKTKNWGEEVLFNRLKILPIFFTMFYTMGQPGFQKLFNSSKVMGQYVSMFQDSFLAQLPGGVPPFIYLLGLLEFSVPLLLLVSAVKREWLPSRPQTFFSWAMLISITNFIMLAFGLGVLLNFPGSTNLIFYAIISLAFYTYTQANKEKRGSV